MDQERQVRCWAPHTTVARLIAPVAVALLFPALVATPPARATLVGDLSGRVTGAGTALANVWVTITPVTESGTRNGSDKVVLTDADGRYHLTELYSRTIKVHARAPAFTSLVDAYWPDAHSFGQAGIVAISSWPVVADIDLPEAGSMSGRVLDVDTGAPVVGARVSALLADAPAAGQFGAGRSTDRAGEFTIGALPPARFRLRVRLPPDSMYLITPARTRPRGAIRVQAGRTTTEVELRMQRGAEIRGTVRDDLGTPVAGATIKVIGCAFACPLLATSDQSGAYRIAGVQPADRLGVVAWRGEDLLRQWYPDRGDASLANDIALSGGDVLDSVDFALTRAAFLDLEVRNLGGNGPVGAIVVLRTQVDGRNQYFTGRTSRRRSPVTPAAQTLRVPFGPLPPGRYDLRIAPSAANPGYVQDRWVASVGVAPDGSIRLGPGERAHAAAGLVPAPLTEGADEPWRPVCPSGRSTWPGLPLGFLAQAG